MRTTFLSGLCRLSGRTAGLLLSVLGLPLTLVAQVPAVLPTSITAVPHNETYSAPWQTAVSNKGDFVLLDFGTGGVYEYPANGGPEITIAAPSMPIGGFDDNGIAIDPRNNNLYLDNNYNGGLLLFPYDAQTGMWDLPSQSVAGGLAGNLGGSCGNYFQGAGLAINSNGLMAVATENGCGVEIFTVPIDASGNFGTAVPIVANMSARAKTVAIDNAGNISFNEDAGGLSGVLFIPAGTNNLADDKAVSRVDPTLGAVQGVTIDLAGNLYIADGTAGEYFEPLVNGVPTPGSAIPVSTATANGGPSFDASRQILFVPTSGAGTIKDLVDIHLFAGESGSVAVGTTSTTPVVTFDFNASTTPVSFVITERNGTGDFVVAQGVQCGVLTPITPPPTPAQTFPPPTTYAAASSCTVAYTFTPHTLGDVSATLLMEDANGKVIVQTPLHGIGLATQADATPATVTALASGLKTPSQSATDASGNVYVADPGLGQVLQYAPGSATGVSIGTGLKAPTGVAVDGAGDVFIADSGSVVEVPYGTTSLNTGGQVSVKTGLGTQLKLAVDGIGDLFVADPDNQRIVQLRSVLGEPGEYDITGVTGVSAIAVNGTGTLYAANGPNLVQYSAAGDAQTLVNTLSGATSLAVDASGAVYVAETGGAVRIPSVNGVLTVANQISVAPGVTSATSVTTDPTGNAYVTDSAAGNLDLVSIVGALNLGTLPDLTSSATANVSVVSAGNLPINITGFTGTPDFSETSTTCVGAALAVGSSCTAAITFTAGPGDQGSLAGEVLLQSDAFNQGGVNVTGVSPALGASTTTTVQVFPPISGNVSFTVTVTPATSGGPVPTGTVTVSISGKDAAGTALPAPVVVTQPLANGKATFTLMQLEAGSYTFAANYNGDRVYGRSSTSPAVTVGTDAVLLMQPPAAQVPQYVLSATNASEPTDGSTTASEYIYPIQITANSGNPLVGVPTYMNGAVSTISYGSVVFNVAGGSAPCQAASAVNANGSVLFNTSCLPIDTSNNQTANLTTSFTLTPVFTSPDYVTTTGAPFTLIALRHPVVVISSSTPTLSVPAGGTATATLSLNSLLGFGVAGALVTNNGNNYTLPVALSCDNLPAHATCSFTYPTPDPSDPNSVDVTPTAPGTVMMTINTDVPVGTSASLKAEPVGVTFAALFGLGLLGLTKGKRRALRQRLTAALSLALLGVVATSLSACSSSSAVKQPDLSSPAGTYTVSVSAKQVGSKVVPGSGGAGTTVTVYGSGNLMSVPFTVGVTVQ